MGVRMRRDDLLTAGLVLLGCLALAILIPGDLIAKGLNFLGLSTVWLVVGLLFVIFRGVRRGLRAAWRRIAARTPVDATSAEAPTPEYRVYTRDFDIIADASRLKIQRHLCRHFTSLHQRIVFAQDRGSIPFKQPEFGDLSRRSLRRHALEPAELTGILR